MPFLAKAEILSQLNRLITRNPDIECVHQASYDLRLGREIYVVGDRAPRLLSRKDPYLSLQPGQFAVLTTHEEVDIPRDMLAFISVRSKFKLEGLVNISGFHVDPSFRGILKFGVQNVGPVEIHLKFCEPTFTIFFANLTSEIKEEDGRDHQDDIYFRQGVSGISLEDVQLLGGNSVTLSALQKEVERLRTLVTIYIPVAISVIVALLIKLLSK
jgi:dCTP deaminase